MSLLVINGLLGALTTLLVWLLVRVLAPQLPRRVRLLATAAVAVYPSWLLYTDLTWSENLLVPICAALVLLAGRLARGTSPWSAGLRRPGRIRLPHASAGPRADR